MPLAAVAPSVIQNEGRHDRSEESPILEHPRATSLVTEGMEPTELLGTRRDRTLFARDDERFGGLKTPLARGSQINDLNGFAR